MAILGKPSEGSKESRTRVVVMSDYKKSKKQDETEGKLPPYNQEAEDYIVAAILMGDDGVNKQIRSAIRGDYFYIDANRQIYESFCKLFDGKMACDAVAVAIDLKNSNRLQQVGSAASLSQRVMDAPVISVKSLQLAIASIINSWKLRQAIVVNQRLLAEAYNTVEIDKADEFIFTAISKLKSIVEEQQAKQAVHIVDAGIEYLKEWGSKQKNSKKEQIYPTSFPTLNKDIVGYTAGDVHVIAGRPGGGKTSLLLQEMENVINFNPEKPTRGLFFSYEMKAGLLATRLFGKEAGVGFTKMVTSGNINKEAFKKVKEDRKLHNIYVYDSQRATIQDIANICRIEKERALAAGEDLAVVGVDYFQRIKASIDQLRSKKEKLEIAEEISEELKCLSVELDLPLFLASQLNREIEKSLKPRLPVMGDLKGCGNLEQDAGTITFVHRPDMKNDGNGSYRAQLICLKARHAQVPNDPVEVIFDGNRTIFCEP